MSINFYQNLVVGVAATADADDFSITSQDKLYYHFDCHDAPTDITNAVFAAVSYGHVDNAQDSATSEGDGQGGTINRWSHSSGMPDFSQDDLLPQMKHLVNFYMMNGTGVQAKGLLDSKDNAQYATANAAPDTTKSGVFCETCAQAAPGPRVVVTNVFDEEGTTGDFLLSSSSWATMLTDQAGKFTANQLNLIIDHLGTAGRLSTVADDSSRFLVSGNLITDGAVTTKLNISITYEALITVEDAAEEPGLFSSKKFSFRKGSANDGTTIQVGSALDASGAGTDGRDGYLRFRKTYIMESATPVVQPTSPVNNM